MTVRILHLVDSTTHEDALKTLRQLIAGLASPVYEHVIGLMGPTEKPAWAADLPTVRFGMRLGWLPAMALPIRSVLAKRHVHLIHAWSATAAAVAQLASRQQVTVIVTPGESPVRSRWSRWHAAVTGTSLAPAAVACPSQVFRRRAIESGIPVDLCGVIRPAVDFGLINAARHGIARESLGLPSDAPVLLLADPPSRAGGHYRAIWAAALLQQIWPDLKVVMPGVSKESRRMKRFVASFNLSRMLVSTGRDIPFEQLLSVCDIFVTAANADVACGSLVWAMAGGLPIVGCAVPSVAEYIADHQNGLLCKPNDIVALATRIRTAYRERDLARSLAETARGQAYQLFSLSNMIRNYATLYDNVLTGHSPFAGIQDASQVA